jgi:hypothetical protein
MSLISNSYGSGLDGAHRGELLLKSQAKGIHPMAQFNGLGEISLIGTDSYTFKGRIAHRYHFATWKVVNIEKNLVESDRFYVWADAVDLAYKIAVNHVYRGFNEPFHPAVDSGEGGSLYEGDYDQQHREIELDSEEDWSCIVEGNYKELYYS